MGSALIQITIDAIDSGVGPFEHNFYRHLVKPLHLSHIKYSVLTESSEAHFSLIFAEQFHTTLLSLKY